MTRPPDPAIRGTTLTYMPIGSAEATRRILHLAYRDCRTAIDLTYGAGRFWAPPPPPGLSVWGNNLDPDSVTPYHRDFTATGLADDEFDLAIYDPPHLADGGERSVMAARFGTVKGTDGLRVLIVAGALEARRIARIGVLVKVADHSHGGRWLSLSDWVTDALPERPYFVLHTYRPTTLRDGKWVATRVPRCNGSVYLAFRLDSPKHRDFDREYAKQEAP